MNDRHRTSPQEKVWINRKTNFHYIQRGIDRTPTGTKVEIVECNRGINTGRGVFKGTIALGLRNINGEHKGQMIAFSFDREDLELFAMEYNWVLEE